MELDMCINLCMTMELDMWMNLCMEPVMELDMYKSVYHYTKNIHFLRFFNFLQLL
jgi:hypothetical protein